MIKGFRKVLFHLFAIVPGHYAASAAPQVQGDNRLNLQLLPTKQVVFFIIKPAVGQKPMDGDHFDGRVDNIRQVLTVATGTLIKLYSRNQMTVVITGNDQLGPSTVVMCAASTKQIVPGDMMTFQSGRINGGLHRAVEQT